MDRVIGNMVEWNPNDMGVDQLDWLMSRKRGGGGMIDYVIRQSSISRRKEFLSSSANSKAMEIVLFHWRVSIIWLYGW